MRKYHNQYTFVICLTYICEMTSSDIRDYHFTKLTTSHRGVVPSVTHPATSVIHCGHLCTGSVYFQYDVIEHVCECGDSMTSQTMTSSQSVYRDDARVCDVESGFQLMTSNVSRVCLKVIDTQMTYFEVRKCYALVSTMK